MTAQGPTQHPQPPGIADASRFMPHVPDVPDEVPEEMIADLKAQAWAASRCRDVRIVRVDGIDHDFVLRRPTREEWKEYWNNVTNSEQTMDANHALAWFCCLWPSRPVLNADEAHLSALPIKLVDHLETWAGWARKPQEAPLDASTKPDAFSAFGLTQEDVTALLARYPRPYKLRMVAQATTPVEWPEADQERVCVVVRDPEPPVYNAYVRDSGATGGAYDAMHALTLTSIVHPADTVAIRALLDAAPGVACRLATIVAKLGGTQTRSTVKKR